LLTFDKKKWMLLSKLDRRSTSAIAADGGTGRTELETALGRQHFELTKAPAES
jgi:hypothetical protein